MTGLDELLLGRQIGRGLTCTVLVGARRSDGARCALKVIERRCVTGEKAALRILREKEALLAAYDAPGVVRLLGTLKDEARLYFVLEYLNGGELLWHIRRGGQRGQSPAAVTSGNASVGDEAQGLRATGIDAAAARIVTGSVVLALDHLYDRLSLLYRDLKPTNILFTANGVLKLVDFGHAKFITACPKEAEASSSLIGTRHYHAPEVIRGEAHGVAAQLWALGVLIAEMVDGQPPFWSNDSQSIGLYAANGGYRHREDVGQDVHSQLELSILAAAPDLGSLPEGPRTLVESLLIPDPTKRLAAWPKVYQSVKSSEWLMGLEWEALSQGKLVANLEYHMHAEEIAEVEGIFLEGELSEAPKYGAFESWDGVG